MSTGDVNALISSLMTQFVRLLSSETSQEEKKDALWMITALLNSFNTSATRLAARLKKAEEVVMKARQLTAYSWEDRLEDCEVSDAAKHDSRELSTAIWFYDQEEKS